MQPNNKKKNSHLSRPARITLGYLAVAAVWIFTSDGLVALLAADHAALVRIQAWKGAAFVLVTGLALYALLRAVPAFPGTAQREAAPSERYPAVMLALTFVMLAAVITGFGTLAYRQQAAAFKSHQYEQQTAIAELKAGQIEQWFAWHRQEAEQLQRDPDLMEAAQQHSLRSTDESASNIRQHFEGLLESGRWAGIGLYRPDGEPLILAGESAVAASPALGQAIAKTAASGGFRLNDLHGVGPAGTEFRIDFLVPIAPGPGHDRPSAVMVLSVDPRESLFPMVQSWPVPSASSEVLLVRREGDEVVFMTPLRHAAQEPLTPRRPLSEAGRTIAQAVVRGEGAHEGTDYRGVAVLAASEPVPGTLWYIVAKTDTEEVMLPLQQQARLILLVVLLAIGVTGLFVALLWHGRQAAFARRERRNLEERDAMAHKFEALFQHARDGILLIDPAGRVVEANEAALAAYGFGAEGIRRLSLRDLCAAEAQADFERDFQASEHPRGVLFETTHRRKDGSTFPVEVSSRTIDIGGEPHRHCFIRDIGARRQGEEKIRQQLEELRRWHEATLDREDRVGQLKAEVNELRRRLGEPPRYAGKEAAE